MTGAVDIQRPNRGFETAEFENRCAAAQAAMATRDLDAMLFASESDIRYFTGFMTQFWQSPTRPWFIIIPREGSPIAVIPTIGVPLMRDCYIGDIHSWPHPLLAMMASVCCNLCWQHIWAVTTALVF